MIGPSRRAPSSPQMPPNPARLPTRPRPKTLMRRFTAQWMADDGQIDDYNRIAPASAFFEGAFNALVRGALLSTPNGPVAIEDLLPGDEVDTAERGAEPILWKGSLTLYPSRQGMPGQPDRLFRLTADALGYGRPMQDLLLGTGAEIWSPHHGRFVPAVTMLDGVSVIELAPPAPVTAFQVCLSGRRTLLANGVAVSSYAPDETAAAQMSPEMLALFLTLFPNRQDLEDLNALARADRTSPRPGGPVAA